MQDELKEIWRTCFADEETYIDLFFTQRYRPENTLVHYEAGRPAAMMTLLPVTVVTPLRELKARYVYAVATIPEFRSRGISSRLALQAEERMIAEGSDLAVVVPATPELFNFYVRQGFYTAFYYRVVVCPFDVLPAIVCIKGVPITDIDLFYTLRERHFGTTGFFVRWDKPSLQYALNECRISGGDVYYFSRHNKEGYVVVEPQAPCLLIKEIALPPELIVGALTFLKKQYKECTYFHCRLAADSSLWNGEGSKQPVAMLKWLVAPPEDISVTHAYINLIKD